MRLLMPFLTSRESRDEEPDLSKDVLAADKWIVLGYIRGFSQASHDATKAIEDHKATLEQILATMDF
ncbi:hypothetical protein HO173_012240 [Letharia columbiana]|uniref:Uncharacterized protein n=1 Tax=Letharia columbiana TaxID=112416 RepID=A0A8H6CQ13_9LECA|nr:uncharacterized protein HO173_012240 [Letharia columbiana]KAF6227500.1 hypothetical protein HO173_012240 [Letharia columbiana]